MLENTLPKDYNVVDGQRKLTSPDQIVIDMGSDEFPLLPPPIMEKKNEFKFQTHVMPRVPTPQIQKIVLSSSTFTRREENWSNDIPISF